MNDGGGITVGRHTAGDGAGMHPLVAAALEARQRPRTGAHRPAAAGATPEGEGDLGWPGSPGDGDGLGWPGDADAQAADVPAPKRSAWRRLFGGAERARQDTSAA
ncbi:hypothetical protein [Modestobacter lapidis]